MIPKMGAFGKRLADKVKNSLIISALSGISDAVYKKASEGCVGWLFTQYDRESRAANESMSAGLAESSPLKRRFIKPLKRFLMVKTEQSFLLGRVSALLRALMCSTLRSYGIFFMAFGILSALMYLLKRYAVEGASVDIGDFIFALAMLLLSLPLLPARISLSNAVVNSRIMSFLLFDFAGIRRESVHLSENTRSSGTIAFTLGTLFGILTYAVSPLVISAAVIGAVGGYLVLLMPEIGVVMLFAALAYLPTMALAALTVYTAFCYFLKVVRGKRIFRIKLLDGAVIAFMAVTLLGGVVSVAPSATVKPAMLFVCFMCGYILTVNLIRSSRWVTRCFNALAVSSFGVAALGVFEYFFGSVSSVWQDEDLFSDIKGRVVSTFDNPNVLAEYLIMSLPVLMALFLISKKRSERFGWFILGVTGAACLVLTWSRGAWLGMMAGIVIFFLIYSRKTMVVMLFGVAAVPFLPFVLPASIVNRFMSIGNLADSSTNYRVNIWRGTLEMIEDHLLSGIGIGNGAFSVVYPKYSLMGIESAPHSHNLYLQITLETGIFGILIFAAVIFIFCQCAISQYADKSYKPNDRNRLLSAAAFSGIAAVLVQGMTDYVWYNYRIFLLFWLLIGLTAASAICSSEEKTERIGEGQFIELDYSRKK